jgi:SWI/SNF-related matrix-associated actin-dependent regulator 1 of chromatin subfamily A
VRYHGSAKEREEIRQEVTRSTGEKFVIITSFAQFEKQKLDEDIRDLSNMTYNCCIIDECQSLKSAGSTRVKRLLEIDCTSTILLTGNDPRALDLPTLAHFLLPLDGKDTGARKRQIEKFGGDELEEELSPLFLRRLQSSVVSKTVAKFEKNEAVTLEPKQQKIYDAVIATNTHSADETVGLKERDHIFKELRKAANHPMLLRRTHTSILSFACDF